jgi:hypothetical protein
MQHLSRAIIGQRTSKPHRMEHVSKALMYTEPVIHRRPTLMSEWHHSVRSGKRQSTLRLLDPSYSPQHDLMTQEVLLRACHEPAD